MDAETLEALRGSIEKWRGILAETEGDEGSENCALCTKFLHGRPPTYVQCGGCPVAVRTKQRYCDGSPYRAWDDNSCENRHELPSDVPARHNHLAYGIFRHDKLAGHLTVAGYQRARAELNFLISLLPEGEQP